VVVNAQALRRSRTDRAEPIPTGHVQQDLLPGDRLHLQHGPINLVIKAYGGDAEVRRAYERAERRLNGMLQSLVANLSLLRSAELPACVRVTDATSQQMISAAKRFKGQFVTPMAAVAGAVADTILGAMKKTGGLHKIYVNNGGDIALHLAPDQHMQIGIVPTLSTATPDASLRITGNDGVGGIATSGWDGHSMSQGIADAVTVIAASGAIADVAATLIANRVNCDDEGIERRPARDLDPDTDLGERLVTVGVGELPENAINDALDRGEKFAQILVEQGIIQGALLSLQKHKRTVGFPFDHQKRLTS
jgi:ApbE superfamily uncharacterized protein (UPF0280 family)